MKNLIFKQHTDSAISNVNKGISITKNSLPGRSLIIIYKAFLRPIIDYRDIIYG